ncbi:hypothetical protein NDU88_005503 [Pleurodeles waltl]|uniref:Uncharacterized protein n=1 Tax=Pleurodeles waltl TaxID=8319 RepID=A0AAV7WCX0_PLEWA|nr:hypothetical protein NDU88_005503 [Pleurodeles waltl]
MADDTRGMTMDRILQEISSVSRKLEGMDSAMVALTAETRSMRLDKAGFQSQISGLDQQVATVEMQAARMHGPFRLGALEIRLSADFSKETAERRKAFLALRTRLRHLDVKFSLFEPARMWITKIGESRNFYDPEDLRAFLDGLHDQSHTMEITPQTPLDTFHLPAGTGHMEPAPDLREDSSLIPKPEEEIWTDLQKPMMTGARYSRLWRYIRRHRTETNLAPL